MLVVTDFELRSSSCGGHRNEKVTILVLLLPPFFRSHPPGIPIAITPAPFIWSARSPSLPWTSPPRRAPVSAPISDFDGVADWDDLLDFFSKGGGSVTSP